MYIFDFFVHTQMLHVHDLMMLVIKVMVVVLLLMVMIGFMLLITVSFTLYEWDGKENE